VAPVAQPAGGAETLHVECQSCRALLAVKDVGTYKCPRCLTAFNYAGGGRVSFLPRQKALPVQLSLSFAPECTEGLLEFVKRLSTKSGFSPSGISEMQSAVKDTVELIRRHAYGGNENNVFSSVRRSMDRFELRHHPKGGNVVTVSKKAK
jgi:hypothetical protein